MQHSHLNFYNNAASSSSSSSRVAAVNSILGVEGLVSDDAAQGHDLRPRSAAEKHIDIVDYLKRLPASGRATRATFVDIKRMLDIDLENDELVLDMMKSNPKLDVETSEDGVCSFQYRDKYRITNMWELKQTVDRVKTGVVMSDIITSYQGIEHDCNTLIIGGDIIACKNKALKTFVLYPRGTPFYTPLGGKVTAEPGSNMCRTLVDLTGEIRRGDAIRVPYKATAAGAAGASGATGASLLARFGTTSTEGSWFRVATAELGADRQVQSLSVTSDQESSLRAGGVAGHAQKKAKEYHDVFTGGWLPLDGDFDGDEVSKGKALRHGCTNDVRQCWTDTAAAVKRLAGDEKALEAELKRLGLITKSGTVLVRARTGKVAKTKERKKRVAAKSAFALQTSHLHGTELGRFIDSLNE